MSTTLKPSDEWIGATVKGVAGLKAIPLKRVAMALGMKPPALSNKLHGRSTWSAVEVARAADVLGVEVGELYDGYGGQVPFPRGLDQTRDDRPDTGGHVAARHTTWGLAA